MKTIRLDDFSDFVKWVSKREQENMTTTPASPLEPCPHCDARDVHLHGMKYFYVGCNKCRALGPAVRDKAEAVAAWNSGVLRERLRIALEGKCHESVCVSYEHKLEDAEHRAEAAEARVKELEDMLRWDNDARIAQESREIALDESALERGIREGWEAKESRELWASVDDYLKERKK